jgi:hypothetical protein
MRKWPGWGERVLIVRRRRPALESVCVKIFGGSKQRGRAKALLKFGETGSFSEAAKRSKLSKNMVRKYTNLIAWFCRNERH